MRLAGMRRTALFGVALATLCYALIGIPLVVKFGSGFGSFSTLLVAFAAYQLGWRGGLLVAACSFPISTMHLNLSGVPGWDAMLRDGSWPRLIALVALALAVGWLVELIQRLRDSEAGYRELLEQAADAIFIFADDGHFVRINARACDLTSYSRDELLGMRIADIMPQEEADEAAARIATLDAGTRTRERLVRRKDGTIVSTENSATRLPDGRVQVIIRDVSDRKATEAALRASEERFRLMAEHAGDLIFRYRFAPPLGFEYVSPSTLTLTGYTPEEHYADPNFLMTLIHPDDAPLLRARIRDRNFDDLGVLRWLRKGGAVIWAEARVTRILDERGQLVAIEGIVRDVTTRVQVETALRERDERFQLVARATNDAIWDWDLTTDAVWWNEAVQSVFGYPPEQVGIDASWWYSVIHPDDRDRIVGGIHAVIDGTGESWTDEYRFRHADGSYTEVLDRGFVLRDALGVPLRMLGSMQDLSRWKRVESDLREVMSHARSLLWRAEITERPGEWADGDRRRFSWDLQMVDEAAAQRVLPLDLLPGQPYAYAWDASRNPDDRERIDHTSAQALLAGGGSYQQEFRCRNRHGAVQWLAEEVTVEAIGPGRWRGFGIASDITERKAAEEALRDEERRFRDLYIAAERQARELALLDEVRTALARELAPVAVHRAIVEAIASIFGHTRVSLYLIEGEELVRQEFNAPATSSFARLPLTHGIMARVARTGRPVLLEDVTSDPEFIRAVPGVTSEVCVPLHDDGRVVGVLNLESTGAVRLGKADLHLMAALAEHISMAMGRARLYAAARDNADKLAAAQAIAHLGSWEVDLATRRAHWSDETFRIFGLAVRGELSADVFYDALHPDDRDAVRSAHMRLLDDGAEHDLEYRIVRPDAAVRHILERARVVRDTDGKPVRTVGTTLDITERKALEARLAHQATHDPLTGLPNRTLLLDRLGQALVRGRRDGMPSAVLFLDLDHFKAVNDTLGHDAGDRLLMAVATRIGTTLREVDTLARLGGDEFVALLESVGDHESATQAATRLAHALAAPFMLDGREMRVAASIGVVLATGEYTRAEDVLRDADVALYRAKDGGRAQHAVFDPAMQAAAAAWLALEQELAQAIERGELLLHYQPIVRLRTGAIAKVEALVRWQHPTRGMIPPGDFLAMAEATGLIAPLGRWVLHEACRQAAAWCAAGSPVAVAVNLTAREFQDPALVFEVAAALAAHDLDPHLLWLELTEGAAMGDAAATVATLRSLKALGVRLAIDDFGTGYSSLAYLKRFPVDALKVDRAFVDGLGTDPEDTAIVEAIVTMARTLGLNVVAEGVETVEQAAQLRALGCELGQGYLFARPLAPEQLHPLVAARGTDLARVAVAG